MDEIVTILESLDIDETFFYQMGIFVTLFFVLKVIFFERLQGVIKLREDKTLKRKEAADKKFAEAEGFSSRYREKIKKANAEGREILNRQKRRVVEEEKIRLKKAEEDIGGEFEKEVGAFGDEIARREGEVLKNSDALCRKLVEKLTV